MAAQRSIGKGYKYGFVHLNNPPFISGSLSGFLIYISGILYVRPEKSSLVFLLISIVSHFICEKRKKDIKIFYAIIICNWVILW